MSARKIDKAPAGLKACATCVCKERAGSEEGVRYMYVVQPFRAATRI